MFFRSGTFKIAIEQGRYSNIILDNRFCPICKDIIEYVYYFLLNCPAFSDLRRKYIQAKYHQNPTIQICNVL